ncbi:MAG: glutathione S-transferase family protein [Gammaproteobacteria bacterium]|nr:glutathione S-transferase family protein [Gammaproteobacteria bacterium]
MIKVYGMSLSGNCYKLKLLLELLAQPYQWVEVDILSGAAKSKEFLTLNPNGKVPLLSIDERHLPESNAGLFYLAQNTSWFPTDHWQQAQVMQWLFFEQYSHEPAIAVARFIKTFLPADNPRQNELPELITKGNKALQVMEQHLQTRKWFVAESPSIADIALFAYTHVASDGGFDLNPFPAIKRWLSQVKQLPHFVPMV